MPKIDFVIAWVDDSDPEWLKEKEKYLKQNEPTKEFKAMTAEKIYRDWEILRFWFRAVEKYAPWVNKIFFVTYGHVPSWLNVNHEKIVIVNHTDFLPSEALPTFNSRAIETSFHKIKGLSEHFVYFNDDFFLNDFVSEEDFFKDGLPKDSAVLSPIVPNRYTTANIQVNDLEIINDYFSKRAAIKKDFKKWFSYLYGKKLLRNFIFSTFGTFVGFFEPHIPSSYLKSTFEKVWELETATLSMTTYSKFRNKNNVNQWLFRYWQIASGNFEPRNIQFGKYYQLTNDNTALFEEISLSKHKVICINDTLEGINYDKTKSDLVNTFQKKFPVKSRFEK
ncbi:stealth family protein [Tetragenococcus koreensis]|uniref:Stealth CR1 domain-containing protein n=1 Tax=Tetragenococcus halophilus TaxID=51669 RepID=A0AB35HQT0_TETHA|nr:MULTISPECIES: Stealth CR1 domain-containing protein [Tetragenococcus]MCF1619991.1 stealth family protein [Tetragenococcus koreensis]MCF1657470.1 stealth family protein [Tetragenococcus koreensis]MCO8298517.1 Stealth CR1 domain-containing protein [Tetragenococcus halophilus]